MILSTVMQALADRLDTINGLRVYAYPSDQVTPPAAIVTLPATYTYDETYGRGLDRMEVPVVVLVGKVSDRASRDTLSAYVDGSGSTSIKAVLESGTYTAFDNCRVISATFDVVTVGAVDYLAASLTVDVIGEGSP